MANLYYQNITSPESLAATIDNDFQVYRWSACLLNHPQIKDRLCKNSVLEKSYHALGLAVRYSQLITLALIGIVAWMGGSGHFNQYILSGAVASILIYFVHKIKRKNVRNLITTLITEDFPGDELRQRSIYQIGEHYGKTYSVPSLVDLIFVWDKVSRYLLIGSVLFLTVVHPFKLTTIQIYLTLIIIYGLGQLAIGSGFISKYLK